MRSQLLKSFVVVAETLHFARAAAMLGMAQATLSQQVAALESFLEVQLIWRDNRNVRLTPAGELFLEEARTLLALTDAAVARTRQVARGEAGQLQVGASSAALFELLPMTLARLGQRCPALQINVAEHSSSVQECMLLAGEIDVGLLHPPLLAADLRCETLLSEPMVLALWTSHPLAELGTVPLAALQDSVLLVPEREAGPHLHTRLMQALASAGASVHAHPGPCAAHTVLSLVTARRGIAIVPGAVRQLPWPGVVYRPLAGQPLQLDLAVCWRVGEQRATVLQFRQAAAACAAERRLLDRLQAHA